MSIPKEALEAVFPTPETIGPYTFHPIALAHVLAIASLGNPVLDRMVEDAEAEQIVKAAAVLTWPPNEIRLALRPGVLQGRTDALIATLSRDELAAVMRVPYALLSRGMDAFIPMRDPNEGASMAESGIDNWGWPVVAIEFLMHQYGMTWEAAECVALVRLFVLRALADVRAGLKPTEPSYGERAYIDGAIRPGAGGRDRLTIRRQRRKAQ